MFQQKFGVFGHFKIFLRFSRRVFAMLRGRPRPYTFDPCFYSMNERKGFDLEQEIRLANRRRLISSRPRRSVVRIQRKNSYLMSAANRRPQFRATGAPRPRWSSSFMPQYCRGLRKSREKTLWQGWHGVRSFSSNRRLSPA